jgi:hypothetical protein
VDVIDAHTHAFPPEIRTNRERYAGRERWFGALYDDPLVKLTGEDELLASMQAAGVARSVIAGFPWSDPGLCREHNAWLADVCRRHPDSLSHLAIVVPHHQSAENDALAAFADGATGIGELNADAQGFDLKMPASMAPLMDVCRAAGKPVMLHSSEPLGHDYRGKGTATPQRLATWLAAYSDQPAILAHWGGGLPFYELMPEIREITRNVVYDCAATTYLYFFDVFEVVRGIVGDTRILFGSDFPVLGQKRLLARIRRTLTDEDALAAILGGNASGLFDFDPATENGG